MNKEEFVNQVSREQAALRRFLTALCCGNNTEADDIAQETLVKAFLRLSDYDERGQFLSWLIKIAYHIFLDSKRKQKNTSVYSLDKAVTVAASTGSDESFHYQELHNALLSLSETIRTSMLLFYMQGYSIKEIANIIDSSESAVKKHLSRGREELKNILQHERG